LVGLYDRVMKFDKRIRFVALVDAKGQILEGGMREGVEPIEPLEKTPDLIEKLVSFQKAEELSDFLGKADYSVFVHEKAVAMIFRAGRRLVLVTAGRKFGLNKVARLCTIVSKD